MRHEESTMKNEALKKAVLKANLRHADVALRALDRIDRDDDFRAAIAAVLDIDDPTAIYNVVYAHFEPDGANPYDRTERDPIAHTYKLTISAKEVAKLVNDRALEVCIKLLTDAAIERCVTNTITRHFELMVMEIVGMKKDGFDRLEIDEKKPIAKRMADLIREKALPIFEEHLTRIDLREIADKVVHDQVDRFGTLSPSDRTKEIFERRVRDRFEKAARNHAEELAEVHAVRLIEEHFGPTDDEEDADA